jgi:ssDNA-binding Zn-finger/Zn-ribbon topoisomerase 1
MKPKLKPCPWCGAEVTLAQKLGVKGWIVVCTNYDCDVLPLTPVFKAKSVASKCWNTRKGERL